MIQPAPGFTPRGHNHLGVKVTDREEAITIVRDLLEDAEREVERESQWKGSSYDMAVQQRDGIRKVLEELEG